MPDLSASKNSMSCLGVSKISRKAMLMPLVDVMP